MVSHYDVRILWKYINGYYIENVDELENNYKFMMDVIRITKDKNLYNLCSDEVKNNFEFVKFIIDLFKKDIDFVCKVADYYLDNADNDDICTNELIFIMCDVLKNYKDNDECLIYFVKRASIVNYDRMIADAIIDEEDNINIKKRLGMGFIIFLESDYCKSNIMLKYIAKIMLNEIFYELSNLSIEDIIHKRFSSVDKLNQYGIKNFIFSYVREYDYFLASYLTTNVDLISKIEKEINLVRNNWNIYLIRNMIRKNEIFMQEAFCYIEEYNTRYTYDDICSYIDSLNIIPIKLLEDCYEEWVQTIDLKNIRLNDYICIKKIFELAKELYLSPVIDDSAKIDKNYVDNKNKILKFFPKKVEEK